jgi:hypothetical protein
MKESPRILIRGIIAIDQASVSGVAMGALCDDGSLKRVSFGVAVSAAQRTKHLQDALLRADLKIHDLAVVMEDHMHIPASAGWGSGTLIGMGDARGRWREKLEDLGHPRHMLFDVDMKEWRGDVLGRRFATARKEIAKPEAIRWAEGKTKITGIDHNAAEAVCLLYWAARTLPKRLAAERMQRDLFTGVG